MTADLAQTLHTDRSRQMARLTLSIVPPLIGAGFLMLWIFAETGRAGLVEKIISFVLLSITIGISGVLPRIALCLVVLTPLGQFAGVIPAPESTTWPSYLAVTIVGFFVGMRRDAVRWPYAVGAGCLAILLAALNMVFPHSFWPPSTGEVAPAVAGFPLSPAYGWVSWIGQGGVFSPVGVRQAAWMVILVFGQLLLLAFAGCTLYLISWAAGQATSLRGIERAVEWTRAQLGRAGDDLRREQERAAIARDVHDTLAHSLAVVVAQAEGGIAAAASDDSASKRALAVIADVSREALIDCRSLVERIQVETGVERQQPTTTDVPALIERMCGLGMTVRYQILGGQQPLPPSRQLTFYRIVQESLTNALKHGGTKSEVTVTADWRGSGLALLVASRGAEINNETGGGAGIAGMRERARLAGGWLSAGPGDDGDFVVTAYLPFAQYSDRERETVDV